MAVKKPSIKEIKTTIESALIYIRSQRKWGKSTLFRNIVLSKYGDPERGLLIGLGDEEGYGWLDQLNSVQITNYADLKDTIEWLITKKGIEHNIEMLAFDVVDELIPLMEDNIVTLSKKETGKPCKTINEAFGGFHNGQKRAATEIKKMMRRLQKAGFGVFAISHTKDKTIKPMSALTEDDGYDVLTSTLTATYESVFSDIFDIIVTGVIKQEVDNKRLKEANRYLYFRDDGYVQAGGRLAKDSIVDRMLFEEKSDFELAKDFVEIVEDAMRRSTLSPISKEEFKEKQEKENDIRKEQTKEVIKEMEEEKKINPERNEEIKEIITSKWSDLSKEIKEEIKDIMDKNNIEKISNVEENLTEAMEEILKLVE